MEMSGTPGSNLEEEGICGYGYSRVIFFQRLCLNLEEGSTLDRCWNIGNMFVLSKEVVKRS
jgi:hypothetical protein